MSKHTKSAYAALHDSRSGLNRLLGLMVVEGRVGADDADRLSEAIIRLNEGWSGYAHAVAVDR